MTVDLDLAPAQEKRLRRLAEQEGVAVSELIVRAVNERFLLSDEGNAASLALVQKWLSEAPTTPEAIAEAEAEWKLFKDAINETRRMAGSEPIYPD